MEVILLEKIGKAGDVGDQITVKAGYARNFLLPYSKAIPATKENIAEFDVRKDGLLKAAAEKMQGEEKRAALLAGLVLTIEANASEEGKLYGSVGTREITSAASDAGHDIDKSEVKLPEGALHEVGKYEVTISLSPEVSTNIKVVIVSSGLADDVVEGAMDEEPVEEASEDATDQAVETPSEE